MNVQAYGVNELSAEEMQGISGGGERTTWYYVFRLLGAVVDSIIHADADDVLFSHA